MSKIIMTLGRLVMSQRRWSDIGRFRVCSIFGMVTVLDWRGVQGIGRWECFNIALQGRVGCY